MSLKIILQRNFYIEVTYKENKFIVKLSLSQNFTLHRKSSHENFTFHTVILGSDFTLHYRSISTVLTPEKQRDFVSWLPDSKLQWLFKCTGLGSGIQSESKVESLVRRPPT